MDSTYLDPRNIANNTFGNNVTIYQGNIQNLAADQRDQCLKDLRPTDPRDDKIRIQQTKGGLLKESYDWIIENEAFKQWQDNDQKRLLWIKGDPGKGKTMLLCGIIDQLTPKTKLAKPISEDAKTILSYFFCQGTDSRINNATAVLRGLIYLIIVQEPSLISHVQARYSHAGKDLFLGVNAWVALSDILENILRDPIVEEIVFIVDALDECENDSTKLLGYITQNASLPKVQWVVSSRNIVRIQQMLDSHMEHGISLELKANAESVSQAVDIYIEHRTSQLRSIQHNQGQKDDLRDALRQKANGTFLWVSLVMKELEEVQSWEVTKVVEEMPMDLEAVYRHMISQIKCQRRGNAQLCWKILSTIFTAYYPLSLGELGVVSGLPKEISEHPETIAKLVAMCGSFLTIRQGTIYFIHQSAKDFLSTETFRGDAAERHADIYKQSIASIAKLPKNIYSLSDFGFRSKNARPPEPDPLASMRYCCLFWAAHFCDASKGTSHSENKSSFDDTLWSFLKDYVLRWLESLALLGELPSGARLVQKIQREFSASLRLASFLQSIQEFLIKNGSIIDQAPLQIYGSALIDEFNPIPSDIKEHQWKERWQFIQDVKGRVQTSNALLQTLEQYSAAVCFSLNGELMASGSSEMIRVWDSATGATRHMLTANDFQILCISISADCGTLLFVALRGDSISPPRMADFALVRVSLNGETTASSLHDSRIKLNDAPACSQSQILHSYAGWSVASFSLDGELLVLAAMSHPNSIELWNAATGVHLRTLSKMDGDNSRITALALSPDKKTVASGHKDGMLMLRNLANGHCLGVFKTLQSYVFALAFRPDDNKLAVVFIKTGTSMTLLDLETGSIQTTSVHHDNRIRAITFSPNGKIVASGSDDGTIQLWDAELCLQKQVTENSGIGREIETMVCSQDGKILASLTRNSYGTGTTSYGVGTIQIWDTTKGAIQKTFDCWIEIYGAHAILIAISPSGKTLALGNRGMPDSISLWDTATGQLSTTCKLSRLPRYINECTAIAFSPDETRLALYFDNKTIVLQDLATGEVQKYLKCQGGPTASIGPCVIAFSPDGRKLAAVYKGSMFRWGSNVEVRVWDMVTGACLGKFDGDFPVVNGTSIKFLPHGPFLCINGHDVINWLNPDAEDPVHDLLLVKGGWISKGKKDLLWLPKELRTNLVAVRGNLVAIGYKSKVIFLWFNL